MKWKKKGKIFDPSDYKLYRNYVGFAQSPQVLILEDRFRIYFSTRTTSDNGKFISHVQFVDMTKDFSKIISTSSHEVIPPGELGCYDEHGIFPFNVVPVNNLVYGYISGWSRRVSVSVETGIGLAISKDNGFTFQRYGNGPVLTTSLSEPFLIVDGFVKHYHGYFHMWYIYGTEWKNFETSQQPERIYKIGHAVSHDGINWEKDNKQIVKDIYSFESQALPTVTKINNKYHMIFCYRKAYDFRENRRNAYRLGYAYSYDLVTWIRNDNSLELEHDEDCWDSDMICYPHIFNFNENVYLLYNGNEFGKHGFGLAVLESC